MDIRQGKAHFAEMKLQIVHMQGNNFLAVSFILPP